MKKKGLSRQAKINLVGYSFILPNIIGVCAFTLFPMLFSLVISFTDWDYTKGIGNWNFIGLKNFVSIDQYAHICDRSGSHNGIFGHGACCGHR